ncbi:hypothetical protein AU476_06205 [Cupriavidus sp. UYMSc13B]|nr:hypothetical protein AU476_06205 [Cupriavidus sp. UYMSc13B]
MDSVRRDLLQGLTSMDGHGLPARNDFRQQLVAVWSALNLKVKYPNEVHDAIAFITKEMRDAMNVEVPLVGRVRADRNRIGIFLLN